MNGRRFHFIGVGGIGMGAIASLLIAKGYKVSGSDLRENQLTQRLRREGAEIFIGHGAAQVQGADAVVYSSAVTEDNPEMAEARRRQIPVFKRAQVLAQLMEKEKGITVAGAHGKTTTTSMIASLLVDAGFNPTTAVGGIVRKDDGKSYNANLGSGQYFVAEVDESDGSFLYFSPYHCVITNIDYEHVDYYHSWENILKAYSAFIDRIDPEGMLFACGEDEKLMGLLKGKNRRYLSYGFSPASDIFAKNIIAEGYMAVFDCVFKGRSLGRFTLKVPGRHNCLNAMACIGVGMQLSIDPDIIRKSLGGFTGVQRRFQLKGEFNSILLIDDYGHHPTEIAATLGAARSFGRKRVVVAFQPHRYTRTKFLMDEFVDSLNLCDYLIVTDIYAASETVIEGVTAERLCEKIKQSGRITAVYVKKEDVVTHLLAVVRPGDLVLTLGAGDITKISDDFVARMDKGK